MDRPKQNFIRFAGRVSEKAIVLKKAIDRDTQREITDWDTGTQMTTGTCVSTDVMFVCRLTSCLSTINDDWDTGTQLQRRRRGAKGDI